MNEKEETIEVTTMDDYYGKGQRVYLNSITSEVITIPITICGQTNPKDIELQ